MLAGSGAAISMEFNPVLQGAATDDGGAGNPLLLGMTVEMNHDPDQVVG